MDAELSRCFEAAKGPLMASIKKIKTEQDIEELRTASLEVALNLVEVLDRMYKRYSNAK